MIKIAHEKPTPTSFIKKVLEEYEKGGVTIKDLARKYRQAGLTSNLIRAWRRKYVLKTLPAQEEIQIQIRRDRTRGRHYSDRFIDRLVAQLASGQLTPRKAHKEFGLSTSTIYKWLRRRGVSLPRSRAQYPEHLRRQVVDAYIRHGGQVRALARRAGVPESTLHYWVAGVHSMVVRRPEIATVDQAYRQILSQLEFLWQRARWGEQFNHVASQLALAETKRRNDENPAESRPGRQAKDIQTGVA